MLLFLVDENLPRTVGATLKKAGCAVEQVSDNPELRQKPDEVIFHYAIEKRAVIITRDLGFANPTRFPLHTIAGIIILRFPNEVSIATLCNELKRAIAGFTEDDFYNLTVIEVGSVRRRKLR